MWEVLVIYISEASSNVPIMDYWRYLNALADKAFMGGVSFSDLYSNNGVHRTPLQLWLFILNMKVFHWNTQSSMYFGVFILGVYASFYYISLKKLLSSNKWILNGVSFLVLLIVFSLGPFEIITQEFFTAFSIRMLSFVLGFLLINHVIRKPEGRIDNRVWILFIYNVFTICILGGAYSMAYSASILLVLFFNVWKDYHNQLKSSIYTSICISAGIVCGDILYLYGLEIATVDGNPVGIASMIVLFVKGLLITCGASLIGSDMPMVLTYFVGGIVFIIHVICVCIFILKKQYKKTYLPANLYLYFCVFYMMIFMARGGFGIEYLASPRYIIDSSLALIGDVFVLALYLDEMGLGAKIVSKVFAGVCSCIIIICIFIADAKEIRIAPYRKVYADNLIHMMQDIDRYTEEEIAAFQANSPEQVRNGIEIMKKYKLGIFDHIE